MFVLVEFTDQKEIAVIPSIWLDGNMCAVWPPFKSTSKVKKAVITKMPPLDSWRSYPIKELYKNESYEKVRGKLKAAELRSDLETANSESSSEESYRSSKRTKTKSLRLMSSSSEETELETENVRKGRSSGSMAKRPPLSVPPPSLPLPPLSLPVPPPSLPQSTPSLPVSTPSRVPPLSFEKSSPLTSSTASSSRTVLNSFQQTRDASQVRDIRMFTILEKIKQGQFEQKEMLCKILRHLEEMPVSGEPLHSGDTTLPESVNFPLESVDELNQLETELADSSIQACLINHFSLFGGKNTVDTVKRILRRALKSRLAEQYNWYGKKGKKEFGKLKLAAVIFKAVKKTMKSVTESEVEVVVREWLRTACDREGGRKRRRDSSHKNVEVDQSDTLM